MTLDDAIALIRPAVGVPSGIWADLGAGSGTFTEALAVILGESGRVLAVDRDPDALASLDQLARRLKPAGRVVAVRGDLAALEAIEPLAGHELDGCLLANALHYLPEPASTLEALTDLLRPGGRVVVVEYDGRSPSVWVPYPLPIARLKTVASAAGLTAPKVVGRKRSAYRGEMYCAVARVRGTQ